MLLVKRLHIFILRTFLPLFAMTFFIVLFIVLMQFLWRYIDDLVGKGLSFDVLAELFFYAAMSMVPMALPLSILLASLMTFGNLGERFELTAMKAAGISLIQSMAPLIVVVCIIAVGAFFFQNDVLPKAQVKMWTLLFSVRQKSPEVEIPEGVFYDQIPGYNLFVESKNRDTGMLYNMMIYDVTQSGNNSTIIRADSALLAFTSDMRYLYLHLWKGEQFENLREVSSLDQNVPFRRENFEEKELLMPFDANFNRLDEEGMRRQYVGKNIAELRHSIDSVSRRVDSIGDIQASELAKRAVVGVMPRIDQQTRKALPYEAVAMPDEPLVLDTLLKKIGISDASAIMSTAQSRLANQRQNIEFQASTTTDDKRNLRRHEIELIKKYTLSVACLIFFFIGAPLGAIIRKGGIGTPLVISVLLFLVYYIIDNTGYKMARDGRMTVWLGIWLSTFILTPLGIYVTYKAMNDSAVFEKDTYIRLIRKFLGLKGARSIEYKEVILDEVSNAQARQRMMELTQSGKALLSEMGRGYSYLRYWNPGLPIDEVEKFAFRLDADVDLLRNCSNKAIVNLLQQFPAIRKLWIYRPIMNERISRIMMYIFPIGLPLWLISLRAVNSLRKEISTTLEISGRIIELTEE